MSTISYKNLLQEHCQKANLVLPIFKASSTGPSHNPNWTAFAEWNNVTYTSTNSYMSKRDAEQDVARQIYEALKFETQAPVETKNEKYQVLIDLENIQPNIQKYNNNFNIKCYLSTYSTVDPAKYKKNNVDIVFINSAVHDAADHMLTFEAAELSTRLSKDTTFVLVSRDRTSDVLASILQSRGFTVMHIKKANDFEQFMERMCIN